MMRKLACDAAACGRLATLFVACSMLALVLLQLIAAPVAEDRTGAQPSAAVANLLRSI
jgi:hypothetical protein